MKDWEDLAPYLYELLFGIVSKEMTSLLDDSNINPEEVYKALLSSTVPLRDKETKLNIIPMVFDCDEDFKSKIEQSCAVIHDALSRLGAFPGVVWFKRVRDGEGDCTREELLLSPDSVKPWHTLNTISCVDYGWREDEPEWEELWRMVPTEAGSYHPDYVYYLNDDMPIFFGKVKDARPYSFPDSVTFEHPDGSQAFERCAEYFCEHWTPSNPLPFEVGDIISFDLRPFGPLRTACVIGDSNRRVTDGETKVLYLDGCSYDDKEWRLVSLSDLEDKLQTGFCDFPHAVWPTSCIYHRLTKKCNPDLSETNQFAEVREYLFKREGWVDRRQQRSVYFQRDWEYLFGDENLISEEQLEGLLRGEGLDYVDIPDSMRLF